MDSNYEQQHEHNQGSPIDQQPMVVYADNAITVEHYDGIEEHNEEFAPPEKTADGNTLYTREFVFFFIIAPVLFAASVIAFIVFGFIPNAFVALVLASLSCIAGFIFWCVFLCCCQNRACLASLNLGNSANARLLCIIPLTVAFFCAIFATSGPLAITRALIDNNYIKNNMDQTKLDLSVKDGTAYFSQWNIGRFKNVYALTSVASASQAKVGTTTYLAYGAIPLASSADEATGYSNVFGIIDADRYYAPPVLSQLAAVFTTSTSKPTIDLMVTPCSSLTTETQNEVKKAQQNMQNKGLTLKDAPICVTPYIGANGLAARFVVGTLFVVLAALNFCIMCFCVCCKRIKG